MFVIDAQFSWQFVQEIKENASRMCIICNANLNSLSTPNLNAMNPFFAQNIAASRTFQIDGVRYLSRAIINKDRSEKYFQIVNTPSFAYFEQHNIDRLQQLLTTCEDAALSPF
jgi:hypothetical protein